MSFWDDRVKALADIGWEEGNKVLNAELSGWQEKIHSEKSKSLEIKQSQMRPKLMIPKPIKLKKNYFPVISTPAPVKAPPVNYVKEEEKIENLIMKLLEKSRKKAKIVKSNNSNTFNFNSRVVTRIPFLSYKLNLPRSLNTLRTPRSLKNRVTSNKNDIPDMFSYRLTGTSLFSKRYS